MRQGSVLAPVLLATAVLTASAQNVTPMPCEGVAVRTAQGIVDAIADTTLPDVNICVDQDVIGYAPCRLRAVSLCPTAPVELRTPGNLRSQRHGIEQTFAEMHFAVVHLAVTVLSLIHI